MEMTMRLPANYNVMNEEEMTYTDGGLAFVTPLSIFIEVIAAANWIDLLMDAREWRAANKSGDVFTDLQNGLNAWIDYTSSSPWNAVRSIAATFIGVFGTIPLGNIPVPYGAIGSAIALLTV